MHSPLSVYGTSICRSPPRRSGSSFKQEPTHDATKSGADALVRARPPGRALPAQLSLFQLYSRRQCMIPQTFDYSAPQTLQEALALLESGERKILAGGMSLIPLMK